MSAPEWLVDLLGEHSEPDHIFGGCKSCGHDGDWDDHVAEVVWAEIERRVSNPESMFELGGDA